MTMHAGEDTKFSDEFDGGDGSTVVKNMRGELTSNSHALEKTSTQENVTPDVGGSKKRSREEEEEEEGILKKRSGSVGEDGNADAEWKNKLLTREAGSAYDSWLSDVPDMPMWGEGDDYDDDDDEEEEEEEEKHVFKIRNREELKDVLDDVEEDEDEDEDEDKELEEEDWGRGTII